MLGAIIGDIVGSIYEFANIKTKDFPFFSGEKEYTDDSVLCIPFHHTSARNRFCCWSYLTELNALVLILNSICDIL